MPKAKKIAAKTCKELLKNVQKATSTQSAWQANKTPDDYANNQPDQDTFDMNEATDHGTGRFAHLFRQP